MRHPHLIFGIVLLSSSWLSAALTLGPMRGEALIGQPLDVTVSVQTDPTEDASALCWSADLLSAETRQSISPVRVLVEAKGRTTTAALVRVVSAGALDEPIITLNLSAGCQQKTTRHYVLLADLPTTPTPAALITTPAPATQPKRVMTPTAAPASTKPASPTPTQTGAPRPMPAKPKAPARAHAGATDGAHTEPPSTQARLQLEALDKLSDRVADVNLPMTFAPSADALHQAQALEALQQEVAALRALEARNEASITNLKHRLRVLESRREQEESSSVWLLWLGLLALLSGGAWWWQQRTTTTTSAADLWWRSLKAASPVPTSTPAASTPAPTGPADTTTPQPLSPPLPPLPTPAPAAPSEKALTDFGPVLPLDIDIDLRELHELSESNFNQFMEPPISQVALTRPSPSAGASTSGAPGHLSLESLFDIRQQAEFFISLGQTNQAIELLKKSTQQGEEHNPFIYLDLLGIFHTNALLSEFRLLRNDCNLLFNVKVPEFALFDAPGHDLLDYPELLGGICAAWRNPDILQVLEPLIFRDPWDATKGQTVDLAAFRDLLWLHQVAQTLLHKPRANDDKPWAMSCPAALS